MRHAAGLASTDWVGVVFAGATFFVAVLAGRLAVAVRTGFTTGAVLVDSVASPTLSGVVLAAA